MKKIIYLVITIFFTVSLFSENNSFIGIITENSQNDEYHYGVKIISIFENGPADSANFHLNDIILKINNEKIYTSSQLKKMLTLWQPGNILTIEILRDSKTKKLSLKIGEKNNFIKEKSYLGVIPIKISDEEFQKLKSGLKVEVLNGTPADKDGLKSNDIILECNHIKIYTADQLQKILSEFYAGDSLDFKIFRNNKTHNLNITLESQKKWFNPNLFFKKFSNIIKNPPKISIISDKAFNFAGITLIEKEGKIIVSEVSFDSQLKNSIKENDQIISINKKNIKDLHEFQDIYMISESKISIKISSNNEKKDIKFEKPSDEYYINEKSIKMKIEKLEEKFKNFSPAKIDSIKINLEKKLLNSEYY